MIVVRSPLRISLGGGGTDLPSYYKENEGFLIAAAINKYVFVSVMNPFTDGYTLKYSEYENVNNIEDINGCQINPEQSKISNAEQGSTYRLTIVSAI